MGRPQAAQLNKRIAKTLSTQVADSAEALAGHLETSPATILRFRATGLITLPNLRKIVSYYFFPVSHVSSLQIGEKKIESCEPLSVKIFSGPEQLTYCVALEHKDQGTLHINVVWASEFEGIKGNADLIRSLLSVGYHFLIVIDSEELPKLYNLNDLWEKLPKKNAGELSNSSTEALVKELSERGYKVTLEIK